KNNIGVEAIDREHKELFSAVVRMKKILEQNDHEKNIRACVEMMKFFKYYTLNHLKSEEAYMRSIKYEDYDHHVDRHNELRALIPVLEETLEKSNYSFENVQHFLGVSIGWLTGHIMTEDKMLGKKRTDDLRDLDREEGIELLSNTICEMINIMFNINATLEGEHEEINRLLKDCVICELTYVADGGESIQVIIMLEERLVLGTIGSMVDIKFNKIDKIVLSATTELTKIIMQRVKTMFKKYGKTYTFANQRIMTFKEVKKHFKNNPSMYSLLFNTEIGNCLFCISHVNQNIRIRKCGLLYSANHIS
ncbi:MAG: hemerythrin family protein, partial [Lachnospiraceae bacterium]|nr:hemerythrin family protein [Lachnospiraceae bacterium]